jgi:Bax protein
MALKFFKMFLLLCLTQQAFSQSTTTRYIHKYLPLSQQLSLEFGIPVSIILGVAIHESASGKSVNCRQLNNHFGVKGKNQLKKRKTKYKQYLNAENSFRDFCKIMSRKNFYSALKYNDDYRRWLTEMNKMKYAGAKQSWINIISKIIRQYKLDDYNLKH